MVSIVILLIIGTLFLVKKECSELESIVRSRLNDTKEVDDMLQDLKNYRLSDDEKMARLQFEFRKIMSNQKCVGSGCNMCPPGCTPTKRTFKLNLAGLSTMGGACGACPDNLNDCFNPLCITADGEKRSAMIANFSIPGPPIEVCEGDTIEVEVRSKVAASSFHWHGITQENTQFMDGVSFLTQCKIGFNTNYKYEFNASTAGTHIWYPMEVLLEGSVGGLIVRSCDDPWGWLYDVDDHVIILQDWIHENATLKFVPGRNGFPKQTPESIIINGRGANCIPKTKYRSGSDSSIEGSDDVCSDFPLSIFKVEQNKNYRIRIIHGGGYECPLQFQIENHEMILIAADGNPVTQVAQLKTIIIMPGERYDVVISANQLIDSYWILVKAIGDTCAGLEIYQRAILTYEGAASETPDSPNPGYEGYSLGRILNPLSQKCIGSSTSEMNDVNYSGEENLITCAYQLRSFDMTVPDMTADTKITLEFEKIYEETSQGQTLVGVINGKSLRIPTSLVYGNPDILSLYPELECDEASTAPFQKCYHQIDIHLGHVVDLFLVDNEDDPTTPNAFHLHGYKFYLLYQGYSMEDAQNDALLNFFDPSLRDTVVVPVGGVVRIRFQANNPGLWLLRNTLPVTYNTGMGVVLQVGTPSHLPHLPDNYPQCEKTIFPNINALDEPEVEILDFDYSCSDSS